MMCPSNPRSVMAVPYERKSGEAFNRDAGGSAPEANVGAGSAITRPMHEPESRSIANRDSTLTNCALGRCLDLAYLHQGSGIAKVG